MVVLPVLFLLGSLFHCGSAEDGQTIGELLKNDALSWEGPMTCKQWDCECVYTRQRGCCCAANDMFQLEDDIFKRIHYLWHNISTLKYRVHDYTDGVQIAFKATMDPSVATMTPGTTDSDSCFGPFNTNVPIPYGNVALNHYHGYNPSMGVFTAPYAGVYVFSITVYSYVKERNLLYHKVQLMRNGVAMTSVWENNREDFEDNAVQETVMELQKGDQVYVELMSGRKLCRYVQYNIFTGYILYPYPYPYHEEYDYEYEYEY
ncbi:cerebellin 18 [Epinephelus fuscoguttatus]|uniref:cerebellin 18 n=1 Tax=Epinephelus fuscoguttatus TaxID=293821 RepID=UPI0020D16448|nr:cerebellin 18 [Epinephelus fuscoguttatus]